MPLAGDHLLIDLLFSGPTSQTSCRLYGVKTAGAVTQSTLNTFANTLQTTLAVSLLPCISADATFDAVAIKAYEGGGEVEARSTGSAASGSVTGDMFPEENVVCLQRRTGLSGRNKRGRIFIPFIGEADADNSTLTAGAITRFKTLATALGTDFVGGGLTVEARTPDFVNNLLVVVSTFRVVGEICSRRDRRAPKKPLVHQP